MITTLISIQSFVLFLLSLIHFSWVLGSTWGFDKALPTNEEGKRMLNPTRVDSAFVAFGLFLFATYYLLKGHFITLSVPSYIFTYAGWSISGIFILRAIGDFKYIGFFKKVRNTEFANLDSKFYSPLCLALSAIGVILELSM